VQEVEVLKANKIIKSHGTKMPAEGGPGTTFDKDVVTPSDSKRVPGSFGETLINMLDVLVGTKATDPISTFQVSSRAEMAVISMLAAKSTEQVVVRQNAERRIVNRDNLLGSQILSHSRFVR
jgi:hypothetical protein